jgi:hypothetical protein
MRLAQKMSGGQASASASAARGLRQRCAAAGGEQARF